jgi:hypothetical protein
MENRNWLQLLQGHTFRTKITPIGSTHQVGTTVVSLQQSYGTSQSGHKRVDQLLWLHRNWEKYACLTDETIRNSGREIKH